MIIEGPERQFFSLRIQLRLILPGIVDILKRGPIDIVKKVDKPDISFEIVMGHRISVTYKYNDFALFWQ